MNVADDDPEADWTAAGVFRCAPGVHRIPLPLPNDGLRAVNVYAVADREGWTLIDAGWALAESRERLAGALGALGADFGNVRRFLVTHAHRDHYTLAVALRREFGTRVALGAGERPSIEVLDASERAGQVHVARLLRAGAPALAGVIERSAPQSRRDDWTPPDEWLDDGAGIDVGAGPGSRRLRAIATPGHTRGHVVFADDAAELVFAGDHVLPRITPSIGLEAAPPPSPLADFLASLELMTHRPDAALLPAHGPVGRRVHERVDELLAHHAKRLDATLAAVQNGCSTAHEVAAVLPWTRRDRRLDELDPFNAMLAVLETSAHLDVLATRGGVTATTVDGVVHYRS